MKVTLALILLPTLLFCEELIQERRYDYPQFEDISPCPCDLSPGCDTYCCCDTTCPEETRLNHTCDTGLFGGQKNGKGLEMNCSESKGLYANPFFDFLCVYQENSPYLGHFYPLTDKLENVAEFDKALTKVKKYELDYEISPVDPEQEVEGYKEGTIIKTVYDRDEGITGQLSLPVSTFTGSCTSGPVRYLRNSKSSCFRKLSPEICANGKNSVFDHQMYLMNFPGIENEPTFAEVLSRSNVLNTTTTTVNYYTTATVQNYASTVEEKDDVQSEVEDFQELLLLTVRDFNGGLFQENVKNSGVERYEKLPYFANYDSAEMECRNIALEVRYSLYWSGTQIHKVAVDILLGNISLENQQEVYLNQYFDVKFIHQKNTKKDKTMLIGSTKQGTETILEPEAAVERSGNPGYIIGKPIVTVKQDFGKGDHNVQPGVYQYDTLGFRVWASDSVNSLCVDSQLRPLEFGVESESGCFIRLQQNNISNCQDLSSKILKIQDSLLRSQLMAKDGSLNLTESSLVQIIYEHTEAMRIRPTNIPTCQVPSTVRITVLFTHSGIFQGQAIRLINGVRVTPVWNTWRWTCKRDGFGDCKKTVKYLLKTEVEFVEIPAQWHHANTSKFWVIQDGLSCEGDVCWESILEPFVERVNGNTFIEALEWMLLLFLLIIPSYSFHKMKI